MNIMKKIQMERTKKRKIIKKMNLLKEKLIIMTKN